MLEEVADTLLGVPGPALVRRWCREAPTGFVFTALAPKELGAEGFKRTADAESAWENFLPVARDLSARAIVVTSPPDLPAGKIHRATVRNFFEGIVSDRLPTLVWEPPPAWSIKDSELAVKDLSVLVARDPMRHQPFGDVPFGYYRLPGPAGHKSRYEDPAIAAIAKALEQCRAKETLAVFANVDMHADAKRLKKLVGV